MRYAKRGRLRFASHRDFQRALERALRRAAVPIAFSVGFSPHPKVSYLGAAPTGAASEAEYLELSVTTQVDLATVWSRLDGALPDGLDVVDLVLAQGGSLADRLEASDWELELQGVSLDEARAAVSTFLATPSVMIQRATKSGNRTFDVRGPVRVLRVQSDDRADRHSSGGAEPCAILRVVVQHTTPAVRPDDVLTALQQVAGLTPPVPALVTRLAQGPLLENRATPASGSAGPELVLIGDPLAADRVPGESAVGT